MKNQETPIRMKEVARARRRINKRVYDRFISRLCRALDSKGMIRLTADVCAN